MLGFWIGKEYWNQGYCTEATKKIIEFGFTEIKLQKIDAYHFANNPASGKVMLKSGMKKEGYFKQYVKKANQPIDCIVYSVVLSL